jgi:hypothetical protein
MITQSFAPGKTLRDQLPVAFQLELLPTQVFGV